LTEGLIGGEQTINQSRFEEEVKSPFSAGMKPATNVDQFNESMKTMVIHNPSVDDRPIKPMKHNPFLDNYDEDEYKDEEVKLEEKTEGMTDVVNNYQTFMTLPNFSQESPKGSLKPCVHCLPK
jgi:hypothetical protein